MLVKQNVTANDLAYTAHNPRYAAFESFDSAVEAYMDYVVACERSGDSSAAAIASLNKCIDLCNYVAKEFALDFMDVAQTVKWTALRHIDD